VTVLLTLCLGAESFTAHGLFPVLPDAEVVRAIEFGRTYPATRWPGTEPEWQKELLIPLSDVLRFRTIQVVFLTPWLQLAVAAWDDPFTYGDPTSPAVQALAMQVRNRLVVQVWYVPRDPRSPDFRQTVDRFSVHIAQAARTIQPLARKAAACRSTRFPGCVAVDYQFHLSAFDVATEFAVHVDTGREVYRLGVAPTSMR
jgi:hypothetical protein